MCSVIPFQHSGLQPAICCSSGAWLRTATLVKGPFNSVDIHPRCMTDSWLQLSGSFISLSSSHKHSSQFPGGADCAQLFRKNLEQSDHRFLLLQEARSICKISGMLQQDRLVVIFISLVFPHFFSFLSMCFCVLKLLSSAPNHVKNTQKINSFKQAMAAVLTHIDGGMDNLLCVGTMFSIAPQHLSSIAFSAWLSSTSFQAEHSPIKFGKRLFFSS